MLPCESVRWGYAFFVPPFMGEPSVEERDDAGGDDRFFLSSGCSLIFWRGSPPPRLCWMKRHDLFGEWGLSVCFSPRTISRVGGVFDLEGGRGRGSSCFLEEFHCSPPYVGDWCLGVSWLGGSGSVELWMARLPLGFFS